MIRIDSPAHRASPARRSIATLSRREFVSVLAGCVVLPACEGSAGTSETASHAGGLALPVGQVARASDRCDAEAINRAIEQVHTQGGGAVLLDARMYTVCAPIMLKSGVTLRGRGASRTIISQGGSAQSWAHFAASAIICTNHTEVFDDIHVQDLAVTGLHEQPVLSGGAFYAKCGIAILNARRSSIERCAVSDTGTGIGFFGRGGSLPHQNLISDCEVRNASSWVGPGNRGTPRGITMATDYSLVRNCAVEASHTGYYVATEHGRYENCTARGWRDDGFYVNANYCLFTKCRAIAADTRVSGFGSGFAVNPSKGNIFSQCVALRCSNAGMRFRHAGKIAPSDNRVISCAFIDCGYGFLDDMTGTDPFPAAVARRNEFIGNTAESCQFCGFLFVRQSDGIIRENRAISNNRGGITAQNRGAITFAEYCMNNVIEDNHCDDPAPVKTQTWGLYIYPKEVTRASVANVGNRIRHKSDYGIDVY